MIEPLGLLGILALWGAIGLLPAWLALIPTRGRTLVAMPLSFVAGIGGGAFVPLLGGKDFLGFGIGLLVALIAGALATLLSMTMQPQVRADGKAPNTG